MTKQNISAAVMAQRHEPMDSLDFFPTPPWATRALCEWLAPRHHIDVMTCWEPACGQGDMARPLAEHFDKVFATDVIDRGGRDGWRQDGVRDFLLGWDAPETRPHWIVTNPPFRLAADFVRTGLVHARAGVAMLVRTAFLEGGDRLATLFRPHPPAAILQFSERVPMVKGRLDPLASTATAYAWVVWDACPSGRDAATEFHWIAPCRKRLDLPGDWPVPAVASPGGMFGGGS